MQSLVTAATTAVPGTQNQISIQACSGLSTPLMQASPTNYSTFQASNDDVIENLSARKSVNVSTSISEEQESQFQDAHSQRKVLASSNINLSRIKSTNDIFTLWYKGNYEMGLLVPLSNLSTKEKTSIKGMKQRWSQ